jgi:hypothetical protein
MELTIKGEALDTFVKMASKDEALAKALARQWIRETEPTALAAYLLYSADLVADLLAERFTADPQGTVDALGKLPERTSPLPGPRRRGRPPGRPPGRKAARRARAARPSRTRGRRGPGRPPKRRAYTPDQISALKKLIVSYIGKHPGATRKQLHEAIDFPSLAIYHRVMGELRDDKVIIARGDRSKTTYTVKGKGKRGRPKKK